MSRPLFQNCLEIKKTVCYNQNRSVVKKRKHAVVAELAYALDSGSSSRKGVRVQVPSTAL